MANLTLKTNDTYPALKATLSDLNGPVPLNGATVTVVLKGSAGGLIVGNCTIINANEGIVSYQWEEGDTAVADTYEVEFMVDWGPTASGEPQLQKFPNAAANNPTVEIDASLDGAAG